MLSSPGSTNLPVTLAGDLIVYVLCPLVVISIAAIATWAARTNKRLTMQDQALAVIIQQVAPPGSPSLSELLSHTRVEVAELKGRLAVQLPGGPL